MSGLDNENRTRALAMVVNGRNENEMQTFQCGEIDHFLLI